MERRDACDIDGLSREVEWSFGKSDMEGKVARVAARKRGRDRVSNEGERMSQSFRSLDVRPSPTPISAFQPFSCRPSGDGSGEKLKALLSQREVMLQLPLHSRPQ